MTAQPNYNEHFFTRPLIDGTDVRHRIVMQGSKHDFGGIFQDYWLRWNCITKPVSMAEPHSHDFDEIFHFFGADASDISDFQAVVEFTIGENLEVHTITEPTIVYVPRGLVHAPINVKTVNRPIIFMNVANASEYSEIPWEGSSRT
jgi:hypothetical protein